MFEKLEDLKVGDTVVISVVPGEEAAICDVIELSKKIIVVESVVRSSSQHPWWREFKRDTGINVGGEKYGKILQKYEIAIKEIAMVCPYTSCGQSQKNFFMAKEFLQGGKNCNCLYCKKLIWLDLDGNTKKVTVD